MPPAKTPHDRHIWEFQWVRDLLVFSGAFFLAWLGYRISIVTVPLLVALAAAYCCEPIIRWLVKTVPRLGRTAAAVALLATFSLSLITLGLFALVPMIQQGAHFAAHMPQHIDRAQSYLTDPARPEWVRTRAQTLLTTLSLSDTDSHSSSPDTKKGSADSIKDHAEHQTQERTAEQDSSSEPAKQQAKQQATDKPEHTSDDSASEGASPSESRATNSSLTSTAVDTVKANLAPTGNIIQSIVAKAAQIIGGTTSTILNIGLFIIIFIFAFVPLAASFPSIAHWLFELLPERTRRKGEPLIERMDTMISGFVRGRLITAGILGVVYALGWSLCGVPYAIILGLTMGIASLVPYSAVVGLPIAWALLAVYAIGADDAGFYAEMGANGSPNPIWWKVLLMPAIVNVVAQALEDYVLTPLIQGDVTDLHPVVIMLAIIAGGSLAGLYGMILAVPFVACLKVMFTEVIGPRLRRWAADATESSTRQMNTPKQLDK